jgi:Sulfotransferase domain
VVTRGRRGRGKPPTFLVIGAQKSATTSVVHDMGCHPEVFTLPQEVHFFVRRYERGLDWYRERFSGAGKARAVGESSPSYMYLENVAERIARDLPGARLIAVLRDPVDRAYSHYWHNRTRGHEDLGFAAAVAAEPERIRGADVATRLRYSYLDRGRYLDQLRRVCHHLSRNALRVILFEDVRDDRLGTIRSLVRFVGVDETLLREVPRKGKNRFMTFRSAGLRDPIRRLPEPLRKVAARLNTRYAEYPPMAPDLRRELVARFGDENEALAAWLGRDQSSWGPLGQFPALGVRGPGRELPRSGSQPSARTEPRTRRAMSSTVRKFSAVMAASSISTPKSSSRKATSRMRDIESRTPSSRGVSSSTRASGDWSTTSSKMKRRMRSLSSTWITLYEPGGTSATNEPLTRLGTVASRPSGLIQCLARSGNASEGHDHWIASDRSSQSL